MPAMRMLFGDRLDRYLGASVAAAWCAALLFMVMLVSLIDLLLHIGGYLKGAEIRGVGGSRPLPWDYDAAKAAGEAA